MTEGESIDEGKGLDLGKVLLRIVRTAWSEYTRPTVSREKRSECLSGRIDDAAGGCERMMPE